MDCFLTLQNQLFEQLNSLWESDDEEILEKIDELLLQEGSNYGLSLNEKANLRKELFRSIRKLDVLQELLEDTSITEIMVNGWDKIFIEREGHLITWNKTFTSSGKLEDVIQQIVARCNRVINTLHPIVDARLENGARVNAVIPPISVDGPILTIRQFPKEAITMKTLLEKQSITKQVLSFLLPLVKARYTILIGGGTGAGKTTFLNALSAYIPKDERIITIEDNAELQIQGIPNLVRLECRMANIEDSQEITTADLLKTALRMRPDRIIVGEVRSEASAAPPEQSDPAMVRIFGINHISIHSAARAPPLPYPPPARWPRRRRSPPPPPPSPPPGRRGRCRRWQGRAAPSAHRSRPARPARSAARGRVSRPSPAAARPPGNRRPRGSRPVAPRFRPTGRGSSRARSGRGSGPGRHRPARHAGPARQGPWRPRSGH